MYSFFFFNKLVPNLYPNSIKFVIHTLFIKTIYLQRILNGVPQESTLDPKLFLLENKF